MSKYEVIEKYLDELIPNPVCELNYFNDYSLLIAIMLSAQTTDIKVNKVNEVLLLGEIVSIPSDLALFNTLAL